MARHRFVWLYFQNTMNLWNLPQNLKVLHFAPESPFQSRFRKHFGKNYITTDLMSRGVDVKCDIMDLPFEDGKFDIIYCSHVLEHIDDDRKAMAQLRRVLSRNGRAIIMVPINMEIEKTYEDPTIISRDDRLKHFGQEDHVRVYGRDFRDRLRGAGLRFKEIHWNALFPTDVMANSDILSGAGLIYECTHE